MKDHDRSLSPLQPLPQSNLIYPSPISNRLLLTEPMSGITIIDDKGDKVCIFPDTPKDKMKEPHILPYPPYDPEAGWEGRGDASS